MANKTFSLDFPSMPSVSSPSMPEIGGTPYGPWNYTNNTANKQSVTNTSDSDSVNSSAASIALSAETISGLGGLDALSGITEDGNLNSYLSAISGLSELTGTNSTLSSTLQSLTQSTNSATTNTMLAQILEQLQILSEKTTSSTDNTSTENPTRSSSQIAVQGSKLLRFRANGTDLLGTCRTVYFSEPEENGIFLLTGDRVFYIGSQIKNETFYFLFKPSNAENGSFVYTVEAELFQDSKAAGSNLFPLSENLPLIATRTGNLVTLRYSSDKWNLDILIDLQESK